TISDKPSTAINSRHGFLSKKRKPIGTQRSVDESVAEDVPEKEPQARPDPGIAETSQSIPSPVAHAGSDRKHMDLDVTDVSPQPPHEQMDEGFTAMAYPKRRTSTPTGSSGHDESSSLYDELELSDSEEESQEVVPRVDAGGQGEGQAR
nr:hypothetical protein [Tanacetum cinerariifolium]